MLVSFLCGQFLWGKECDFRPTRLQQYLGMLCDSDTTTSRVPQDKLDKLQQLLRAALDAGGLSSRTLQCIAGKCMSMSVAVRLASLWTHAMFAVVAELEKSALCMVDLTQDSRRRADLLGEFQQWLNLSATSQEGPWQRARHFVAAVTKGSLHHLSHGGGGGGKGWGAPFPGGGGFPPEGL